VCCTCIFAVDVRLFAQRIGNVQIATLLSVYVPVPSTAEYM
jgi:hypothetical protein